MKTKKTHITLLSLLLLLSLHMMGMAEVWGGASSEPENLLKQGDVCRKALYRSEKDMKYRHNWEKCMSIYKKVYSQYPESEQAPWALYREARMFTELYDFSGRDSDLDQGIEHFKKFTEEFSDHRLADDAQYRIGEIYYEILKDHSQAYVEFLRVDIRYPSGDMRPQAKAMLEKVSALLNKHPSFPSGLTSVKDIRHWSTPTYARVVIDLEDPVDYSADLLERNSEDQQTSRLCVDLEKTRVNLDIESFVTIEDALLQEARAEQLTPEKVRVVLDADSIDNHQIFALHDPFRIVVDMHGAQTEKRRSTGISRKEERPVENEKEKTFENPIPIVEQLGLGVKTIVIDPGHGGKDPGTYVNGRIQEKDIVLSLAKILAKRIKERFDCDVFLTRDKDVFMTLEQRTAFAVAKKADLFISLHVNAYRTPGIHGVETYILSSADDERARTVAATENATTEKTISDLQRTLSGLLLNTKVVESKRLATEVQGGMIVEAGKVHKGIKDLGVKGAPFYVLIGADMPAILVETGFITNPSERALLLSEEYQEKLAQGIVAGIEGYKKGLEQVYRGGG
ncbi:MAG: N-acetylmuramoyl-L-alanine amidase [Deltaproteobacteria bacterium]|nr:N-acetylmuramoyl-L-alanine amidase [Deltaproteobacteria bacterium]